MGALTHCLLCFISRSVFKLVCLRVLPQRIFTEGGCTRVVTSSQVAYFLAKVAKRLALVASSRKPVPFGASGEKAGPSSH